MRDTQLDHWTDGCDEGNISLAKTGRATYCDKIT